MTRSGPAVHRLLVHRSAALRRAIPWALGAWAMAIVATLFYALALPTGSDIGLVAGAGLGFALVVTIGVALWVRSLRSDRSARWVGAPGASGLEIVDATGRVRATLADVREGAIVRWRLGSKIAATQGLALVYRRHATPVSLGARTRDGARVSGAEPLGEPCAWLAPSALWGDIERAVRERAGDEDPPRAAGQPARAKARRGSKR